MADTTSAAQSEREKFEAHAKERGYRLDRSTGGSYLYGQAVIAWRTWQAARCAHPTPQAVVTPDEMSPDFTDTARAALLWVLWHHQGGSSPVGQPIRFALGMGQHDHLNEHQLREAKRWEKLHPVNPSVWACKQEPLTDEQITAIWEAKTRYHAAPIGTTDLEFARDIEAAHGIVKKGGSHD